MTYHSEFHHWDLHNAKSDRNVEKPECNRHYDIWFVAMCDFMFWIMDNDDDIKANWCKVQNRKKNNGRINHKKLGKTIEIGVEIIWGTEMA